MEGHLKFARALTDILDNKFGIGKFRIGLDPILGLIPGLGDILPAILSLYLVWIGIKMKLPQEKVTRMIGNVLTDLIIGFIPIVGDIGDFFFKSNSKNMKILEEYLHNVVEADVVT